MKIYLWGHLPEGIEPLPNIEVKECKFVYVKEGQGKSDPQELHDAGDYVMIRNLMAWVSDRDLTLEECAKKWETWRKEFFSGLDPKRAPKAIMIDHVRYKDRKSEKSIAWLTENIIEPLQKIFPSTVVSLYGHPSGQTLWSKDRFAEPNQETTYWIRAIGHWAREGRETVEGFMAKIASLKLAGYSECALWFDGRITPIQKEWDQMWQVIHLANNKLLKYEEPQSTLPPVQQPGEDFIEYLKRLTEYHQRMKDNG